MNLYHKVFIAGMVASAFWMGCVITTTDGPAVSDEEIANTRFVYDPDEETQKAYIPLFDHFWSSREIDMLSVLPGGISIEEDCESCNSNVSFTVTMLKKLLVKEMEMERKLDLYTQYKDSSGITILFEFDRSDENSVRSDAFFNSHFSQSERIWLGRIPYGLSTIVSATDGQEESIKSLLAKLLVKTATIDRKLDSLTSSPTLNIDPEEFIRQYLATHPELLGTVPEIGPGIN